MPRQRRLSAPSRLRRSFVLRPTPGPAPRPCRPWAGSGRERGGSGREQGGGSRCFWPPLPTASSSSPTSSTAEALDPVCPKTGTSLASSWGDWWDINAISKHQSCYATARPDCTSPFPLPRSQCCQRPGLLGRSSAVNSRDTQPSQMLERSQQLDLGRTGQSEMEALCGRAWRRRGILIYSIIFKHQSTAPREPTVKG